MKNPINGESFYSIDFLEYFEDKKDKFISSYNDIEGIEVIDDIDDIEDIYVLMEDIVDADTIDYFDEYIDAKDMFENLTKYTDPSELEDGIDYIHEYDFTEYIKDLIYDSGYNLEKLPCYIIKAIDWEEVAYNLRSDYNSVYVGNHSYLYR